MTLAAANTMLMQTGTAVAAAGLTLFGEGQVPFSREALTQARAMTDLPDVVHALGLPDLHKGVSVPNGFVLATRNTIIPAAVGKDINCGMRLMRTNLHRNDVTEELLRDIAEAINLGKRWSHVMLSQEDTELIMRGGLAVLPDISEQTRSSHDVWQLIDRDYIEWEQLHTEERGSLKGNPENVSRGHIRQGGSRQLGTLGSGNHFLEFQVVDQILNPQAASALGIERGAILMMIHSGSRGMGQNIAVQYNHRAHSQSNGPISSRLRDVHAIPFLSELGQDYWGAMNSAMNWAYVNRMMMGALALYVTRQHYADVETALVYDMSHNMAKIEEHGGEQLIVHRKGAARALPPSRMIGTPYEQWGQPVVIPGSMGTASYLAVGVEGSAQALHSVNHGAGRVMRRAEALGSETNDQFRYNGQRLEQSRKRISEREFRRSMRGVILINHDKRTIIGEAPMVYKDIDAVMHVVAEQELAGPVARMRPIGVIKE